MKIARDSVRRGSTHIPFVFSLKWGSKYWINDLLFSHSHMDSTFTHRNGICVNSTRLSLIIQSILSSEIEHISIECYPSDKFARRYRNLHSSHVSDDWRVWDIGWDDTRSLFNTPLSTQVVSSSRKMEFPYVSRARVKYNLSLQKNCICCCQAIVGKKIAPNDKHRGDNLFITCICLPKPEHFPVQTHFRIFLSAKLFRFLLNDYSVKVSVHSKVSRSNFYSEILHNFSSKFTSIQSSGSRNHT